MGIGALAQLGERLLCKHQVIGSIPIGSTIFAVGEDGMSQASDEPSVGPRRGPQGRTAAAPYGAKPSSADVLRPAFEGSTQTSPDEDHQIRGSEPRYNARARYL